MKIRANDMDINDEELGEYDEEDDVNTNTDYSVDNNMKKQIKPLGITTLTYPMTLPFLGIVWTIKILITVTLRV